MEPDGQCLICSRQNLPLWPEAVYPRSHRVAVRPSVLVRRIFWFTVPTTTFWFDHCYCIFQPETLKNSFSEVTMFANPKPPRIHLAKARQKGRRYGCFFTQSEKDVCHSPTEPGCCYHRCSASSWSCLCQDNRKGMCCIREEWALQADDRFIGYAGHTEI